MDAPKVSLFFYPTDTSPGSKLYQSMFKVPGTEQCTIQTEPLPSGSLHPEAERQMTNNVNEENIEHLESALWRKVNQRRGSGSVGGLQDCRIAG